MHRRIVALCTSLLVVCATHGRAQATPEVTHAAMQSPLVASSYAFVVAQARLITNPALRSKTLDAITNPNSCVAHRRNINESTQQDILAALRRDSLLVVRDSATARAGVFPPLRDDGTACPKPIQSFHVSAGGNGGHHDYPGGLPVHEAYNLRGGLDLVRLNSSMYFTANKQVAPPLHLDVIRAATLWHDWAKTLVLQWRDDGTLTPEIEIAGTGAHHILGVAEAMARDLGAEEVIAQVSSHASPGLRDNAKIILWLRAAAIIARVDPVSRGYLARNGDGTLRLATVRAANDDSLMLQRPIPFSAFPEAEIVNISDENLYSIAATAQIEIVLAAVAPQFSYDSSYVWRYRNEFRNPILSYVGADRLALLFRSGGSAAVVRELKRLWHLGVFQRGAIE